MPHERSFQPRALAAPRWFTPHVDRRFVAPCSRSWGSPRCPLSVPVPQLALPTSRWPGPPTSRSAGLKSGTSPRFPRCRSLRRTPLDVRRTASPRPAPSLSFPTRSGSRRRVAPTSTASPPRRCAKLHVAVDLVGRWTLSRLRAFGPRPSRDALTPPSLLTQPLRGSGLLRPFRLPRLRRRGSHPPGCFLGDSEVFLVHRVRCVRRRCQPPHTLSIPWACPLPPRMPLLRVPARPLTRGVGPSGCPVTCPSGPGSRRGPRESQREAGPLLAKRWCRFRRARPPRGQIGRAHV